MPYEVNKNLTTKENKMTFKKLFTSIEQLLANSFTKEQAPIINEYKRAVYPLFGLVKKSREINAFKRAQDINPLHEMKAYASEFLEDKDIALTLAIKSAYAFENMHKGYTIEPLETGDFIASRDCVSVYVKALPCVESLFYRGADTVSVEDIHELSELKNQHKCSAAVYLSFSHTGNAEKSHCKVKDVFGLDGLTLFSLLNEGQYNKHSDYIEQYNEAA